MQIEFQGLSCDNMECNYTNEDIKCEDYHLWVGKKCPDCDEVLLSLDGFNKVDKILDFVAIVNAKKLDNNEVEIKKLFNSFFNDEEKLYFLELQM